MVAVDRLQRFDGHAEIACRLPEVGSVLHRPGRRGMPQRVRRDAGVEAGSTDGTSKALAHRADGLAIPFDDRMQGDAEPLPAAQMRQQAPIESDGRLPLLGLWGAFCTPIEHATL